MFFLYGYGELVKHMWKTLTYALKAQKQIVLTVASSGSELGDLLKQTKQFIWDEAPMTHKFCFEAVHRNLADILGTTSNDSILFRGNVVVFLGDFTQILPVVPR
ncbi:hypothetical protein Lal_00020848 [Lupinus albus]|nr:hypothetical protein Lal_00020848 [Lupinus albus]